LCNEPKLSSQQRQLLLELARRSVEHGVHTRGQLPVDPAEFDAQLQEPKGCFVTLQRVGALRGCVGSLKARAPLVQEVAGSAYAAAFRDTRFPPMTEAELEDLDIHISVLSVPTAMSFESEADLLAQLRPGVDGLILSEGARVGTFLPDVWEKIPSPEQFFTQLRLKAGLPRTYWSDTLRVERYTTEGFG
jgi:AmmeMemoRadiSam system protein A